MLLQPHYSAFFREEPRSKLLVIDRSWLIKKFSDLLITVISIRHFNPYLYPEWLYADVVVFVDEDTAKIFKPETDTYIDTSCLEEYLKSKSL